VHPGQHRSLTGRDGVGAQCIPGVHQRLVGLAGGSALSDIAAVLRERFSILVVD
jgi:hypothetical protein